MIAADDNLNLAHLTEFLAGDYGKLRLYMGESVFNAMGRLCLATYSIGPPKARALSQHLPNFLDLTTPFSRSPELSDLARLEKAFHAALHAPDAPIVGRAACPQCHGWFHIALHPSVQRLQLRTNAASIWAALTAGELPPPPERLDGYQELLVWRQGLNARFRMLGLEEAIALDTAAHDGKIELDQQLENFLRGWLEAEAVSVLRELKAAGRK